MYNKIYDFCKVRNEGNIFSNSANSTPRVQFLINLLELKVFLWITNSLLKSNGYEYKFSKELQVEWSSHTIEAAHENASNKDTDNFLSRYKLS
jgi:hypothetical protein